MPIVILPDATLPCKNYSSFRTTWMMSILHFAVQKCPQAHVEFKKIRGLDRRYDSGEFRSLQMNWTNSFFSFCSERLCSLAMLFCHLGIFLYGKHCLHLSHYYPFQSLSQAKVLQHFRCPQGSSTNYLHEWDYKTLRKILHV